MSLIVLIDGVMERRICAERTLREVGYQVEAFAPAHALDVAEQVRPDLIIVALELRDEDGTTIRDSIRKRPNLFATPLVVLANGKNDQNGAPENSELEPCVYFPFLPGELLSAVEHALRQGAESRGRASEPVDILIDPFGMTISVRGKPITTTTLEFRLLDYLARHQGKAFTRDALLDAVWGDLRFVTPRSVDACIRRLRSKIEPNRSSPQLLLTVRGTGYRLIATRSWDTGVEACQCRACEAGRERAKNSVSRDPVGGREGHRRAASRV
jgi:two-component system phosphate regulon response regulator PhoB